MLRAMRRQYRPTSGGDIAPLVFAVIAAEPNSLPEIRDPLKRLSLFRPFTKRLSDMTDAELAALEQRMIAAAPIVLEATADVSDDAGDVEDSPPDAPA
jgi:hypothetical protein